MIEIIKEGQRNFITKCLTCGCEFPYQLTDAGLTSVKCPCCGRYIYHNYKINEPKESAFPTDKCTFPRGASQTSAVHCTTPGITVTSSNAYSRSDSLQIIHDLCIDYDGFNTVDGLKSLIDDIRAIAEEVVCKEKEELS